MKQQTMHHIGREIHDNVGQKLTLASLYTQQLAYENKVPLVQSTIENISTIINQSLTELRQLSKSLTCNIIESNNLQELLITECKRFNELKKCKIRIVSDSIIPDLAYQTKSVLLRISQEFIQNSIRHSQCKNINISLNYTNSRLNISLEDDGRGFNVNKNKNVGTGLIHIKKRAKLIGAIYTLESNKNMGTKLTLELFV
jgi:signal transduction histidine kinase